MGTKWVDVGVHGQDGGMTAYVHYAVANTVHVSQTQTHFKPPMYCAFVNVTKEFSFIRSALFITK